MVQKVVNVVKGVFSMLEEVMCVMGEVGNIMEVMGSREYGGRFIVEEELDVVI